MVRAGRVPDVLGALEHAEGQARKKVPGGHEASRRSEAEAGGSWKKQDTHKKKREMSRRSFRVDSHQHAVEFIQAPGTT